MDTEIDFNKLVVIQMNRCNLELSEGSYRFATAVLSFSCMLAHLKQRDKTYQDEAKSLDTEYNVKLEASKKNLDLTEDIRLKLAIKEYEMLVRLCARHNLFPRKRGELSTDDE